MTDPMDDGRVKEIVEDEPLAEDTRTSLTKALEDSIDMAPAHIRDALTSGVPFEKLRRDLEAVWSARNVIATAPPESTVAQIRQRLLAVQLTAAIREQIAQACPELAIEIEDITRHHEAIAFHSAASVDPSGFLGNMFMARGEAMRPLLTEDTCNELGRMEADVVKSAGPEARGLVHLLFYSLSGDLERVRAIVGAQIKSSDNIRQFLHETPDSVPPSVPFPDFFHELVNFLKEYSYISQFLLEQSEYRNGMEERCRSAIASVLRHPSLTVVADGPAEFPPDLDQIFLDLTTSDTQSKPEKIDHPWFQGDLKQTPFDALKVSNILRIGMSYQEKARIFLAINKYALGGMDTTTTLLGIQNQSPIRKKGSPEKLSPEALVLGKTFLALLHPKCIVKNKAVQLEFMDIVKSLEGDERLKNDPELAHSVSILLHADDPFLDIPMRQCRGKSIRELLMNLSSEYFDDDVIRDGFEIHGETVPLFPLPDAEGLIVSPEVPVGRHFNTAFIGLERGHLTAAARAMTEIYSFDEILRLSKREAVRFFSGKHQYRFYFYHSASEAFRAVFNQYFERFEEGEHAIVTNQEFAGFTQVFEQDEYSNRWQPEQSPGVKVVSLNHEETHAPKTVEELFRDISQQVEPKKTKIILISSQTRFGDTPCAGDKGSPSNNLAILVSKLKSRFPDIPVAIDACQAIGRSRSDSLKKLGADIYFTSGGKAMGVGNVDKGASVGVVALSHQFLRKFPFTGKEVRSRYPYYGTLPMAGMAAMSLGMHMLRSNVDLFRAEGNFRENRKHNLEQKIARRMSALTEYVIEQAEQYGETFVREDLPQFAPELLDEYSHEELVSLFGCRVHFPAHRNSRDYNGIVTIDFPTKNGRHLLPVLQAKPHKFELSTCLYKDRALRISLHYLHEKGDIDALFSALRSVHRELLERDRSQGKRLRDARYWTPH